MAFETPGESARHLRPAADEPDREALLARCLDAETEAAELRLANDEFVATVEDLRDTVRDLETAQDRNERRLEAQSQLLTEVIRKYERAVHERNMLEQGTLGYRGAVKVAKKMLPTPLYFKVRKMVRGT